MNLTLYLPWFPILLAVGIGGRLLGRMRGFALGLLCALFWVVLVQATAGARVWLDLWNVLTILSGSLAIVLMGGWAGEAAAAEEHDRNQSRPAPASPANPDTTESLDRLSAAFDHFDDWLENHRRDVDPWIHFDEFIRMIAYQCCRATHVKPYRLCAEIEQLVPLRAAGESDEVRNMSARHGIVGHVATTGRPYLAGDARQGELVQRLAESSSEHPAWCFAVSQGSRRLGVVLVGRLDIPPQQHDLLLRTTAQMISFFWSTLLETTTRQSVAAHDPVSGLLNREAFLDQAAQSLEESYHLGEPVAAAVIALEHLRTLNDSGRWEVADQLVHEAGRVLRQKMRADDRLGRFDGSRFVVLLRRVDSELAALIIAQIMTRMTALCGDTARWRAAIGVRCGVVGSGTESPELRALLSGALTQCRRARTEGLAIATDLHASISTLAPETEPPT